MGCVCCGVTALLQVPELPQTLTSELLLPPAFAPAPRLLPPAVLAAALLPWPPPPTEPPPAALLAPPKLPLLAASRPEGSTPLPAAPVKGAPYVGIGRGGGS